MKEQIQQEIECLRKLMIRCANEKGLSDPQVMDLSRRIDHLHNRLNSLNYYWKKESEKTKTPRIYEYLERSERTLYNLV